jgi:hypothetical protein
MRAAMLGLALGVACGGGAPAPGMGRAGPPPLSACGPGVMALVDGVEFGDLASAAGGATVASPVYVCPGVWSVPDEVWVTRSGGAGFALEGLTGDPADVSLVSAGAGLLRVDLQGGAVRVAGVTFTGRGRCGFTVQSSAAGELLATVTVEAARFEARGCEAGGALGVHGVGSVVLRDVAVEGGDRSLLAAATSVEVSGATFSGSGLWLSGWDRRHAHVQYTVTDTTFADLVDGIPLAIGGALGVDETVRLERVQFLRNHGHSVWPSVESVEPLRFIAGGGPARMDAVLDDVLFDGNTGELGSAIGVTAFDGAAVDLTLRDTRIWRSRTQPLVGPNNQFMTLGYPVATRLPDTTGTVTVTLDGVDFGAGATANERQEIAGCDQPVGGLVSGTVVRQFGASRGCP